MPGFPPEPGCAPGRHPGAQCFEQAAKTVRKTGFRRAAGPSGTLQRQPHQRALSISQTRRRAISRRRSGSTASSVRRVSPGAAWRTG